MSAPVSSLFFLSSQRFLENTICLANVLFALTTITTHEHRTNNLLITFASHECYTMILISMCNITCLISWFSTSYVPRYTRKHTAILMVFATFEKFKYLGGLTGQLIPTIPLHFVNSLLL